MWAEVRSALGVRDVSKPGCVPTRSMHPYNMHTRTGTQTWMTAKDSEERRFKATGGEGELDIGE